MAKNVTSFRKNLAAEPIPESPGQASPPKLDTNSGVQTPIPPNPNPDKIVDEEDTKAQLSPADPTSKATFSNRLNGGLNGSAGAKESAKSAAPSKTSTKAAAPISTASKSVPKPLQSPARITASKTAAKENTAAPSKTATKTGPSKTAAASKGTVSSGKKPAAIDLSPSSTGFVKPKPKSPTRPVNLPASLTRPTASSASKTGGAGAPPPRQSVPHASGNLAVPHRPASRASISGPGAATKTLKRQSSTINRPRPSLGPPPKQVAKDHPVARKDASVDEGFLARMMRPTQSSASKTSDKGPVTPPRKPHVVAAPLKGASKETDGSGKKAHARIIESTKKKDSPSTSASTTSKKHVTTPAVEKVVAAKHDDPFKEAPATPQPTAKDVAPLVAQVETSKEAVEVAKLSKDTATTPLIEEKQIEAEKQPEPQEPKEAQAEAQVDAKEEVQGEIEETQEESKLEDVEEAEEEPKEDPVLEPATEVEAEELPEDGSKEQSEKSEVTTDSPVEESELVNGDADDDAKDNGHVDSASPDEAEATEKEEEEEAVPDVVDEPSIEADDKTEAEEEPQLASPQEPASADSAEETPGDTQIVTA
ncbi:hypothetical protein BX600DRAFT_48223 [Xylariales sp. PMI_506]|nr:hypothetical protein BX600DRAFT_48223 [Xylariales sp. PMI_506]